MPVSRLTQPARWRKTTPAGKAQAFAEQNGSAAEIILQHVERYGGESAGLVIWARMIIDGYARSRRAWGLTA